MATGEDRKVKVCSDLREIETVADLIEVMKKYYDIDKPLPQMKKLQIIAYGWIFVNGLPPKDN